MRLMLFAQEGKQSTTTFSGSGLGLSIVKDIVERMGGTIELESEENGKEKHVYSYSSI